MKIEAPGVVLSFDDWYVPEWGDFTKILDSYKIKVTFYFAFAQGDIIVPDIERKLELLKELEDAGHTIGYHGWNHLSADVMLRSPGEERYIKEEINPGMARMKESGLSPAHFAYPYGHHNRKTNNLLLERFKTVRTCTSKIEEMRFYDVEDLRNKRVFMAYELKEPDVPMIIEQAIENNKIIFLSGHSPTPSWLFKKIKHILEQQKIGLHFYSMDDICE